MDTLISNSKKQVLRDLIIQGKRKDGRSLVESRQLQIIFNREQNGVQVLLGETQVYGKLVANIVEPKKVKQSEGQFKIRVNLGVLMNRKNLKVNVKSMGDEITKILEKSIKGSKALDVESLNIKIGKFSWEIILDLTLIHHDGNILDAMNYAAIALLLRYKFQPVEVDSDQVKIDNDSQKRQFSLNHVPILQTFSILNLESENDQGDQQQEFLICDPTEEEELIASGSISIALNRYGDVCCLHKPGDSLCGQELLIQMLQFCEKKAQYVSKEFQKFIETENSGTLKINESDNFLLQFDSGMDIESQLIFLQIIGKNE